MKVKFIPQNVEYEIEPGESIMKLAHKKGLPIRSVCNGIPSCAECRVHIIEGEHNITPPSSKEISLIGTGHFIDHRRLSCQTQCFGDVTIDLSEQIETEKIYGSQRPQGSLKKESTEESLAVTGNLIDQDKDLLNENDDLDEDEENDDLNEQNEGHPGDRSVLNEVDEIDKGHNMRESKKRNRKQDRDHNRNRNSNKNKGSRGHSHKTKESSQKGPSKK